MTAFFGPVMRTLAEDAQTGQQTGWTGVRSMAMQIMGQRFLTTAGQHVLIDTRAWAVMMAGCRMEALAVRLHHLQAERDVFTTLTTLRRTA
jgi:hypothetical protein